MNIVVSNTDTDLTAANIAYYAEAFLKLSGDSIRFHTLPCTGANIRGGSYVSINLQEWLDMINTYFNPYNQDVKQENLNILMYANGSTWSTTGYSQSISSFYDYNALLATPEPTLPPVVPVQPDETAPPTEGESQPTAPQEPAPPVEEPAPAPLEPAPPAEEPAPPPMEMAPSADEVVPVQIEQPAPTVEETSES